VEPQLDCEELRRRIRELETEILLRNQADEILRKSEERYRMIFNYSPLGIVHFDSRGCVMDCSERFVEIVGSTRERLIGFNMVESLRDERMRSAVIAGLEGKPNYYEGDYLSVTGNKLVPVRAVYSRINSDDGFFLGGVGLLEDITAQRQVEEALQESRDFVEKIIDSISDPIYVVDRQHRYVMANDAMCALAGRRREDILGRTNYDFFPGEQVDIFWKKDELVFQTGRENENEEEITDALGRTRTIATKKILYTDMTDNKFIVGVIRDITERKKAELALQATHRELMDIVEFLPDATVVIDKDKRVILWNHAMEEMSGVKKEQILGKGDYEYAVPFYGKKKPMLIDLVMCEGSEIEKRYDFVKRIGSTVCSEVFVPGVYRGRGAYVWSTAAPLLDRNGSVTGFIQSIRNVSDRKLAEQALKQSEEKYRQLFETVSDAIVVFDAETRRFIDVNERALRLYGYSRDEFLEMKHSDITEEIDSSEFSIEETLAGRGANVPLRYHRKQDGTVFPVEISCSTFVLPGGRVLCGVVRDITERRKVEEELGRYRNHLEELVNERTAELENVNNRLMLEIEERERAEEALKLFAYSIAHDLKSPAVGIHGLTNRLKKKYGNLLDDTGRCYCDNLLNTSEHIAALVDKINDFIVTKVNRPVFEEMDLQEVLQLLRDEFSQEFAIRRIECSAPPGDKIIRADRLSFQRVFRNFIDNSLKYGGEQLSKISIGHQESDDFHTFSVSDNGRGMKGADCEKVFAPFQRHQTSRGVKGAGLGLAIIKEIAEQHGGKVWMDPCPLEGITFFISIRKGLKDSPPPGQADKKTSSPRGEEVSQRQ
jgi:PAS domain S-box-containing protein